MFKGFDLVRDSYLSSFNKFSLVFYSLLSLRRLLVSLSSLVFCLGSVLVKYLIRFEFEDKYILYPPKDSEDK